MCIQCGYTTRQMIRSCGMKKRVYTVILLVATICTIMWRMGELPRGKAYGSKDAGKELILQPLPVQRHSLRPQFKLKDSLSRFGDELGFDYSTCPENSIMTSSVKRSRPPLHNDCPQVFIIGVRKGGTSSLILYLTQHNNFICKSITAERLHISLKATNVMKHGNLIHHYFLRIK